LVDPIPDKKNNPGKQIEAKEAAALLMGLPWELLHDGKSYLFQGAGPVGVRRQFPEKQIQEQSVIKPPLRILLVNPRPENEKSSYFDHRGSAQPLVTALEGLGDLMELTILSPPTFPALEAELSRAKDRGTPYHVVHFDGPGGFYKDLGVGVLVFEDSRDIEKPEKRRSHMVYAKELADIAGKHRIQLFFLEGGNTAQAEADPTVSFAAVLLQKGVGSVVAMSHNLLMVAAKLFLESFYRELVEGASVGEAVLAGRSMLYVDDYRQEIFNAGKLHLQDWFVPVLFQKSGDIQMVTRVKPEDAREINREVLAARMGDLPGPPGHGFIGRGRELLKLERLLELEKYAVIYGQGGEGKTTLAIEQARWLVRSNRFKRAVFVSLEHVFNLRTVVERMGRQLLPNYTAAQYTEDEWLDESLKLIRRELRKKRTIIVLDNMESILHGEVTVPRFEPGELTAFFSLCKQLLKVTGTRIIFTSSEMLSEPFDSEEQHMKLSRLNRRDAVELVQRVMTSAGLAPEEEENPATQPEVETLVESVNCHARSLVLLAPYINQFGVRHTTENLGRLMLDLHRKHGDNRELSLFASLELSLRSIPKEMRGKIRGLGVFQGGGHIVTIGEVLELPDAKRDELINILIQKGLVDLMPYGFVQFHPAFSPYLFQQLQENEMELVQYRSRWAESMVQLSQFLYKEKFKDAQLSATLTTLELPNLMTLLDHYNEQGDSETTINLATRLEQLIELLGKRNLLTKVAEVREKVSMKMSDWGHSRFVSTGMKIERLLEKGNVNAALQEALDLLAKCLEVGGEAYPEALYDTAMAFHLLGRVLFSGGDISSALTQAEEALSRFQLLADRGNVEAERMLSASLTQKGDCLANLGRLEEAADVYEVGIRLSSKLGDLRGVAVKKGQLGKVRMNQKRYQEALNVYQEALRTFENLGEPSSVAAVWHQIGMLKQETGRYEEAEQAYRQSLAINVRQNNRAAEASTLNQLGNLYDKMGRLDEAVIFLRQAVGKNVETRDMAKEGLTRTNLAALLIKLARFDEARMELEKAIQGKAPFGHAAEPWKTWYLLSDLEQSVGNQKGEAEARQQAFNLFMDYRKDGGENHEPGGRLVRDFLHAIQENKINRVEQLLDKLVKHPETPKSIEILVPKLQAILKGSRDPALAEDPELNYKDSVELILLLDALGKEGIKKENLNNSGD
jgi:tetratricopeptide (TPR) repeat protein